VYRLLLSWCDSLLLCVPDCSWLLCLFLESLYFLVVDLPESPYDFRSNMFLARGRRAVRVLTAFGCRMDLGLRLYWIYMMDPR
jgi:hypothetical protein